ncbi:MAG: NitT/TauT family transport system ATP-binding protein [Actinomycetota bacterium]|nr:NitT/TauT family transport system ATP-binding protein [Actinomycetota bacterium]
MTLSPPESPPELAEPITPEPPATPAGTRKLDMVRVIKTFPARRKAKPVVAVGPVDIHVDQGELVCIVGTSGCGKSTLLNIAGGLETATMGDVSVDGEPVIGPGPDRGMVFQGYSLYPWKTVAENISFGLECQGVDRARRAERVKELLAIMDLVAFADRLPKELSGGMRQRVAIARALAPEPDILLLDEPFGSLDAQTKLAMQEFLLLVWQRTGATILMVTHDVEEALFLSQRVYVMHGRPGRVVEVVDVPFGRSRSTQVKRSPKFLDLRDEIQELFRQPLD